MTELTGTFRFECVSCSVAEDHATLRHAVSSARSHRQRENHAVRWPTVEFSPPLATALGPEWEIRCSECHQTWREASEADADAFADHHAEVLDHRPDEIREREEIELDTESIAVLVRDLSPEFDHGVPWPALVGVLIPAGYARDDIERQLKQLQQRGDVYEPRPRRYGWVK
jgi:hypothetical protein